MKLCRLKYKLLSFLLYPFIALKRIGVNRNAQTDAHSYVYSYRQVAIAYISPIPFDDYLLILKLSEKLKIEIPTTCLLDKYYYKLQISNASLSESDSYKQNTLLNIFFSTIQLNDINHPDTIYEKLLKFACKNINIDELVIHIKKANVFNIDVRLADLLTYKIKGGKIIKAIILVIKANTIGINLSIANLTDYIKIKPNKLENTIELFIELKRYNSDVTISQLIEYESLKGEATDDLIYAYKRISSIPTEIPFEHILEYPQNLDIKAAINAIVLIQQERGIVILLDEFGSMILRTSLDEKEVAEMIIRLHQKGIFISISQLSSFSLQGGSIKDLVQALLLSLQNSLQISYSDFAAFNRLGGNALGFAKAMLSLKRDEISISKKELIEHQQLGGNAVSFVSAAIRSKRMKLDIKINDLIKDSIQGREVKKIVNAMIDAKKSNIDIGYKYAVAIYRETKDIKNAIKWSKEPKVLDCKSIKCIAKDGVEVLIKPIVTVTGNIQNYLVGSESDIMMERINTALKSIISDMETYKHVFANLNKISENIFNMIKNEEVIIKNSKYSILNINLAEPVIGEDRLKERKKQEAEYDRINKHIEAEKRIDEARALEAEAKARKANAEAERIEAEAKKEKDIGDAFKQGNFNLNEYKKYKTSLL